MKHATCQKLGWWQQKEEIVRERERENVNESCSLSVIYFLRFFLPENKLRPLNSPVQSEKTTWWERMKHRQDNAANFDRVAFDF